MKIIKDNRKYDYRMTCPRCNSIFDFCESDCKINDIYRVSLKCPLCGRKIFICSGYNAIKEINKYISKFKKNNIE